MCPRSQTCNKKGKKSGLSPNEKERENAQVHEFCYWCLHLDLASRQIQDVLWSLTHGPRPIFDKSEESEYLKDMRVHFIPPSFVPFHS
jgi:hypothetical protein